MPSAPWCQWTMLQYKQIHGSGRPAMETLGIQKRQRAILIRRSRLTSLLCYPPENSPLYYYAPSPGVPPFDSKRRRQFQKAKDLQVTGHAGPNSIRPKSAASQTTTVSSHPM